MIEVDLALTRRAEQLLAMVEEARLCGDCRQCEHRGSCPKLRAREEVERAYRDADLALLTVRLWRLHGYDLSLPNVGLLGHQWRG